MILRSSIAGATALALIPLALILLGGASQARPHAMAGVNCAGTYCQIVTEPDPHQDAQPAAWRNGWRNGWRSGWSKRERARPPPDGRPRAWCGWWMRRQVGRDPGPAFNLARNWLRWGRAASPGEGVIVVWPHHVGMITGRAPSGHWMIKSGNDGHAVRERLRSIGGAIAFRTE